MTLASIAEKSLTASSLPSSAVNVVLTIYVISLEDEH